MLTKILNRFTGAVIFEIECELEAERDRLGLAVKAAIQAKVSLSYANLRFANLSFANLSYADLRSANLRFANLNFANLSYADLSSADLRYANLSYANLSFANLRYANLSSADLRYAEGITDETPLPEGYTFGEFKRDVVPMLLTAGGKTLPDVLASGCWECHEWTNCPMHVALGINAPNKAPPHLRIHVERFVQFFDAGLIPVPVVSADNQHAQPKE